jgi:hypothetical protein
MTNQPELTWEVFHAISTILARFITIRDECNLDMSELYVLAFIKHNGKTHNGSKVALRGEITTLLTDVFGYSDKQVNVRVSKLKRKGCIKDHILSPKEKMDAYGTSVGQMKSVILLEKGYKKIEEFTNKIHQVYLELTGPFLAHATSVEDSRLLQSIAGWLIMEKDEMGV